MKRRIVIALNASWNLVNFRAGLIRALVANGFDVIAVAPRDEHSARLADLGCRYVPLGMDTHGTHPGRDLVLAFRFWQLLRREGCDVYLGYTIKPNIYGSLAAHLCGIPVVNNVSGLGTTFIREGWVTRVVRVLYRLALSRSARVFFQNGEDRQLFLDHKLVREGQTDLLPGSGVDLHRFQATPLPATDPQEVRFLLVARMLWDKGVGEFAAAARILRARGCRAQFCLLGFVDDQNPAGIAREQLARWEAEGLLRYLGSTDDVRPFLAEATCVVLPSYREGTPRSLLEAAAMGRPLIATDVVGCREVVEDGINGFLCATGDAKDLADQMERLLSLSHEERVRMGQRGREKVECEFDERIVVEKYLAAIRHTATPATRISQVRT